MNKRIAPLALGFLAAAGVLLTGFYTGFGKSQSETTLNALFRDWLQEISRSDERRKQAAEVIQRMSQYDSGGPFTRDELNER